MKNKKIQILKKILDHLNIGDELDIEVDDKDVPVNGYWRRMMLPDVEIAKFVEPKRARKKYNDNVGDDDE
jgi:hypothetical protein